MYLEYDSEERPLVELSKHEKYFEFYEILCAEIDCKTEAFGQTFFDVSILRDDWIYVWIYVLDLPNEAENIKYNACMTSHWEKM